MIESMEQKQVTIKGVTKGRSKMCGIAGWVDYERDLETSRDAVEAITESFSRRGPDTGEVWINGPAALGHRRLSVVDFEGGKQPMEAKENGETVACLSYSGEIYNAGKLRDQLKSYGHQFRTRSDTEVVLRGFLEWGDEVAERLEGIFAFAIWDLRKQWLFLVRDRVGVTPLFYKPTEAGVLFGSEPAALIAQPGLPVPHKYFVSALVRGQTLHHGMYEVPAGHIVRLTRKGLTTRRYPSLESRSQQDTARRMQARPQDVVRQQALSGAPLCGVAKRTCEENWSKNSSDFESRFLKNRKLIAFVARRVLDSHEEAEAAVKACFKAASRVPPVFASDGAFRSWILRMVIDEALLILSRKGNDVSAGLPPEHMPGHAVTT
jgi:asparagine synthetase B (glutamine-hydrolysing)